MHLGEEGYMRHVRDIMETTRAIAAGVAEISGLKLLGGTKAMIVCIGSDEINIYRLVSVVWLLVSGILSDSTLTSLLS
jgi:hypothetical protein